MLNIGILEIIIIFITILIFIRPEQWPEILNNINQHYKKLYKLKINFQNLINDIEKTINTSKTTKSYASKITNKYLSKIIKNKFK